MDQQTKVKIDNILERMARIAVIINRCKSPSKIKPWILKMKMEIKAARMILKEAKDGKEKTREEP